MPTARGESDRERAAARELDALRALRSAVLRIDAQLYVPGPEDDVGAVELEAEDWDKLVELAGAAQAACAHWGQRDEARDALRALVSAVSARLARGEDTSPGDFDRAWQQACALLERGRP